MKSIRNFITDLPVITRDIRRCECILFGEEPEFADKLKLPRTILEASIRSYNFPEFRGNEGLMQLNVVDGFLGTIRRFKIKSLSETPNAKFCVSGIDSKEIQLVPCYRAVNHEVTSTTATNVVGTVGPSYIPILNEIITIITLRCLLINIWSVTRGWDNIRWFGELAKGTFYGTNCPLDYDMLRPVNNHKKCGIFLGNLKLYEIQMDNNGKLVNLERMVPGELMGLVNNEDNMVRLLEAYLHLTAKTINCLTFSEKMDFVPCQSGGDEQK